jgi:hypothetical protein
MGPLLEVVWLAIHLIIVDIHFFFGGYSVFELEEKMDMDIRILGIFSSNGG